MNAQQTFQRVVAAVLLVTALVKLMSASGDARSLDLPDPLLYLTCRQVYLTAGILEMAVAGYLLFGVNTQLQLLTLAWLSTTFVAYRMAAGWGNIAKPCGCLGNAMDWFPWLMKHQDGVMKGLLLFMLVGAYGFLWLGRKSNGRFDEATQNAIGE